MKKFAQEFKEFISKGNVVDLAVGVIIGGAFGKIVTSLVNDVIMPLVGKAMGGVSFTDVMISLDGQKFTTLAEAQEAGASFIAIGNFVQNIVDFLVIAFVIFIMIKQISNMKKEEEVVEETPTTKTCDFCKMEVHIEATKCGHCTSELK